MPCLRTTTIHGVVCKFYDGGVVKVGTTAASRFTMKVPDDEISWFPTRLRAELVKRELATAAELPVLTLGLAMGLTLGLTLGPTLGLTLGPGLGPVLGLILRPPGGVWRQWRQ